MVYLKVNASSQVCLFLSAMLCVILIALQIDSHDLALGLSTDGFAVFKKRKHSAWPLILVNYNLPPDERVHLSETICVGVIPGPRAVKDLDSFLYPLVDELLLLAGEGIKTIDVVSRKYFQLRAHLIKGFGDMPAIAKLMRMKGHNGLLPCRFCKIRGIRIPNSRSPAHYVPLDRSQHPDCGDHPHYDPASLPIRTHNEILQQAREVDLAPNASQAERLATTYGVNGTSMLSRLPSIDFPKSFPLEFMHAIWENTIPNIVSLMRGKFKDLDCTDFRLGDKVWEAIGKASFASGDTIPGRYGNRVPDFIAYGGAMTAEAWSFWTMYIAPVLLYGQFIRNAYYQHFIKLVELLRICLKFSISLAEVDQLETGFIEWVVQYEK